MPLIVAFVVSLGSFFGYVGQDKARLEMENANRIQMHWLAQKDSNTAKVAAETLKLGGK